MKVFYNSLIFKLVVIFLIAAIIPLSLSALLFYMQEVSIVEKREMLYDKKVLDLAARDIDEKLNVHIGQIMLLARQYVLNTDNVSIDDKLNEMRLVKNNSKHIDDITLLDTRGNVLCSLNYNYQGSWETKSWYQSAALGKVSISPVHLQPVSQKSILSINIPVLDKDKLVREVLSANIDMDGIWNEIFRDNIKDAVFFMLVDKQGMVIRHPDMDYVMEMFPDDSVNNLLMNYSSGNVRFRDPHNKSIMKNCYLETIKSSSDVSDLGWKLAIIREATDVNQANTTIFEHVVGIFVTGLIFVVVISLAFARIIVRPVLEITSVANQIADGDLNVSVKSLSADEIGDLGRAINEMAEKLQNATTTRNELAGEVMYYEQLEKQLKMARNKAENANRAKDELLACVSHEVRTPLNAIIGYTESLIMDNTMPEYSAKLKTILDESEHLLCLLNDILDNAKIQAGKFDIDLHPCDLYNAVESVMQLVRPKAVSKGLKCNLVVSEDIPRYLVLDSLRLRQVILNLLGNAVKFTNYGFVNLSLKLLSKDQKNVRVRFVISDSGIGIHKDKLSSIFDSYTQADSSTSRKYGGTGLGTTISKSIVDLMGGTIGVESQLGVGSTFWFELSFAICDQQQVEALAHGNTSLDVVLEHDFTGVKVLLVEDYQTSQNLITSQLSRLKIKCELANNGREAVEKARKGDYDIILMDLQMPEMDGITATRHIRELAGTRGKVVIIAMTACVDPEIKKSCIDAGMNDIVSKPLRIAVLASMVNMWVNKNYDSINQEQVPDTGKDRVVESEHGLWDRNSAIELFGNNSMLLDITVKNFVSDVNRQIADINKAIERKDTEFVRAEAHKIKGGASCVAAEFLSVKAAKLEKLASEKVLTELQASLSDLESEFVRFARQIDNRL